MVSITRRKRFIPGKDPRYPCSKERVTSYLHYFGKIFVVIVSSRWAVFVARRREINVDRLQHFVPKSLCEESVLESWVHVGRMYVRDNRV
jgi:hypothetical protein